MWCGTFDLKNYRHEWGNKKTLNNSSVNTVYLDSKNNLWVGTDEGLNLYLSIIKENPEKYKV